MRSSRTTKWRKVAMSHEEYKILKIHNNIKSMVWTYTLEGMVLNPMMNVGTLLLELTREIGKKWQFKEGRTYTSDEKQPS